MSIVSQKLIDPSGNVNYMYKFSLDKALDDSLTNEPVYGISGESYKIVYDNSMTYIGYDPSMSFFNASGEVMYLTGVNVEASMNEIVSRMKK
jgi:hypothetical protein